MSLIDFLFEIGFISEDGWRDKWQKNKVCNFCNIKSKCRPWGAWAHQGSASWICKGCESKKLSSNNEEKAK